MESVSSVQVAALISVSAHQSKSLVPAEVPPPAPSTHTQHLGALRKVSPAPQRRPPRTDAAALRREIDGARSRRSWGGRGHSREGGEQRRRLLRGALHPSRAAVAAQTTDWASEWAVGARVVAL